MNTFILIDGNALIHRAYHAMPPLTNKKGNVVNAVYGFFVMFLNILRDINPEYVAVCFDRSKPTIRQSMYAGYHAHRPRMADDLASQISILDELLSKLDVQMFALDGYEGDDLIGTLATKIPQVMPKSEVVIVTGDRDMFQLINNQVKVLMTGSSFNKALLFDSERVEEKYGVNPTQFVDYKALIGDQSDGYPGVTGIGPKTAAQLLKQYRTFEELYQNINSLPEKYGVKLALDAEQAALAKKLAKIMTDVPIQFDTALCEVKKLDFKALKEGFDEQGFKSLVSKINERYPSINDEKPNKSNSFKKTEDSDGQMELL